MTLITLLLSDRCFGIFLCFAKSVNKNIVEIVPQIFSLPHLFVFIVSFIYYHFNGVLGGGRYTDLVNPPSLTRRFVS